MITITFYFWIFWLSVEFIALLSKLEQLETDPLSSESLLFLKSESRQKKRRRSNQSNQNEEEIRNQTKKNNTGLVAIPVEEDKESGLSDGKNQVMAQKGLDE